MGKTRRQEKSIFDDGPEDLRVEDLVDYAGRITKRNKKRKKRENFEEEYYDYVDQNLSDSVPDEEEKQ